MGHCQQPYGRRVYMDDRVYRSAPASPYGYGDMALDRRTPRYSPSSTYDERYRRSYFDRPYDSGFEHRSLSPYDRGFYGYDAESRWGGEEVVRRYVLAFK